MWRVYKHYIGDEDIMAKHHGTISEFLGVADDWEAYLEQLKSYFIANDITSAGKNHAVLLSLCGTETYKMIQSVLALQSQERYHTMN